MACPAPSPSAAIRTETHDAGLPSHRPGDALASCRAPIMQGHHGSRPSLETARRYLPRHPSSALAANRPALGPTPVRRAITRGAAQAADRPVPAQPGWPISAPDWACPVKSAAPMPGSWAPDPEAPGPETPGPEAPGPGAPTSAVALRRPGSGQHPSAPRPQHPTPALPAPCRVTHPPGRRSLACHPARPAPCWLGLHPHAAPPGPEPPGMPRVTVAGLARTALDHASPGPLPPPAQPLTRGPPPPCPYGPQRLAAPGVTSPAGPGSRRPSGGSA